MGQLLSNLWRKLRPKADNQTRRLDHQSASRDYTEKKQPPESHCINISDHLQPLLNSSTENRESHVNNNYINNNNLGSTSSAPLITTVVDVSSENEDDEDDHQSADHHITVCLDDTEKKQQLAESHCINISDHLEPLLNSSTGNRGSHVNNNYINNNNNNLGSISSAPLISNVVDFSSENEDDEDDHQSADHHITVCLDDTEKKQQCINISDHLQPLLNSSAGNRGSHVNNNNNNLGSTSSAPLITTVVEVSSENEDDHQSANHHITVCLDDTEKKQLAESHCINISEHLLQPYLLNWGSYNNYNNLGSSTPHSTVVDLSSEREKEKEKENGGDQVLVKKVTTRVTYVPSVRILGPYTSAQKLLLVGEGDFSFSACLAVAFGPSNPNIIATSLNSQDFLIKHYRKFPANKEKLETRGNMVLHGVDATKMVKHPVLGHKVFDCIIFNFPHVGKFGRSHSELCLHQKLVTDFLRNAKNMIKRDGEIHITSKSNGFFGKWDIPKLGSRQGLYLIQEVKFNRSKYPGYQTKFGFGGDRDFHCNPSKTYKFGLSKN